MALYDHYLGPNNVDQMAYADEKILHNAVYYGDQKNSTFERYIMMIAQRFSI